MPVLQSKYKAPFYLFNGHLQTIIPAIFYSGKRNVYERERIDTRDGDFLDLDWIKNGNNCLAIITHGLEGCSTAPYMNRMAAMLSANGWDTLSWNFRGCSGEPNNKPLFYHSGFTSDLDDVLNHAAANKSYSSIMLIGFSIGGNVTLKYLGEQSGKLLSIVKKAVVFSVPCDLESGAKQLARFSRRIYMRRFLNSFRQKFGHKNKMFPGYYNLSYFKTINNFFQFDSLYTAPLFGFKDVHDYYNRASSKPYIEQIKIPVLMVNALNDPFLGSGCYPYTEAEQNNFIQLETPNQGGHVGFPTILQGNWPAKRVMEFWNN